MESSIFDVGDKKRFSFKVLIYVITEQLDKLYESKYLMYSNAGILDEMCLRIYQ